MIAIVGPTGSGKTELATALARVIGGEIISADSRQIYRLLDAGTAKPKRDILGRAEGIPYHLIDCADPGETFDAGQYAATASAVAACIRKRGLIPIVAGGTGLYLRSLLEGLSPLPPRDEALRQRLEKEAHRHGREHLHRRLAKADPEAAAKIPANNIQRLIRALEVFELSGRPISSFWDRAEKPSTAAAVLYIDWPVEVLKERLTARAQKMWPEILREASELVPARLKGCEPGLQSLGYREALCCLRGEISEDQGLQLLIKATLAYAKRQRTWFRNQIAVTAVIAGSAADSMLAQALKALGKHETTAC